MVLKDSFLGNFTQKFSFPLVAETLLIVSVFLFFYEGLLTTIGLRYITNSAIPSLLLIVALLLADKSKIKITRAHTYLILFLVVSLFSGVLAVWRGVNPILIILGWSLFVQFIVAVLAAQGVDSPKRLLKNILYLSVPMILVGAYQYLSKQTTSVLWVTPAEASVTTRAFAFFGSPNVLGAVLAILALTTAGIYFSEKSRDIGLISLLATMVMIFTFSRSAWLGFVLALVLVLIIKNRTLLLFTPLGALVILSQKVRVRLTTVFTSSYWFDSTIDGRLWALNNGFHLFTKYPIFGTGPGTYGGQLAQSFASPVYLEGIQNGYVALYFTDNQWLQLLVQTGFVGIILFILFSTNMLFYLFTEYKKSQNMLYLGILGAFIVFLVSGMFGNVLEFGAIAVPMAIILGVGLSLNPAVISTEAERSLGRKLRDSSSKVGMIRNSSKVTRKRENDTK